MIKKIDEHVNNVSMLESTIKMSQRCTWVIMNDLVQFGNMCDLRNLCYSDIHDQAHKTNMLPDLFFEYEKICFDEGDIAKSYQLSRALIKDVKENHKYRESKDLHSTDKIISRNSKLLFNHVQRTYQQYLVFKEHLSYKIMGNLEIELEKTLKILIDPDYRKKDRNNLFDSWIPGVENALETIKDSYAVLKLQNKEYEAEYDLLIDSLDNL